MAAGLTEARKRRSFRGLPMPGVRGAMVRAEDHGYDEVNINVGCPSQRVQSGAFGACLMKTPGIVRDCVDAMRTHGPVTVKCRLGVDGADDQRKG